MATCALVIGELGEFKFFRINSPDDELTALSKCSAHPNDEFVRALRHGGSPMFWLNTLTVGAPPATLGAGPNGDWQLALSVIGDPTGRAPREAVERLRRILQPNPVVRSLYGPVLVRIETADRRLVGLHQAFPRLDKREFVAAVRQVLQTFSSPFQWLCSPRAEKEPAPPSPERPASPASKTPRSAAGSMLRALVIRAPEA